MSDTLKKIRPEDLEHFRAEHESGLVRIDLAYARDDNLLFGERIYREDAELYAHKDLAKVIRTAAKAAFSQGYRLVIYDSLRTTTAQTQMLKTQRVKDNPHWLEEPRLLSPPGAGAHPRAMAIDVSLETLAGQVLDMGTAFDFLAEQSDAEHNPAHRYHPRTPQEAQNNRKLLDSFMNAAAEACQVPLIPLAQEWWDYRLPSEVYEQYAPLSDEDLPPAMRCCD